MRRRYIAFAASLILSAAPAHAQTVAAKLDSIAGAGVAQNRAVGIVAAVVKGNDTLLMKAYGRADVEWNVQMPVDAMFDVGSIAKQFAAVAILQQRDAGKLSLDDAITKWIPSLGPSGNKVTLRHLLTHTSGIFRFSDEAAFEINYLAPRFPRDSALSLIKLDPFMFEPGAAQAYSNAGFWLLGLVVEKASGMKYEDYLEKQIFAPLGMPRSMYCNSQANIPRRAHGYHLNGGTLTRAPLFSYTWVFAPGAVCSTAADLVTWLKALHGGKVLTPKSYAEMTTPATLKSGVKVGYGMGIKVSEDVRGLKFIGHGGTAPGFRADAAWFPESQTAVVVLMNTSPTPLSPAGIGLALAAAVIPPPRGTTTPFTGDATDLVGTYQSSHPANHPPISIVVSKTERGLMFAPGGGNASVMPWAGGLTFYVQETVSLTFHRVNGTVELHRDDPGNHTILKKQ